MDFLIIFIANYVLWFVILAALLTGYKAKRSEQIKMVRLAIIAFPLAYIIAKIGEHFYYDPRPFMVDHVKPLFPHAPGNGFPSDHTLLTMAIASVLFTYNKKLGIVFGVLSLCIGFARVLANVHHSIDIIGSAVFAIAATYVAYLALPYLNKYLNKIPLLRR